MSSTWVLVGTNPLRDWGDRGPEKVLTDYLYNNWDLNGGELDKDSIKWNEVYSSSGDLYIKVMRGRTDSSPATLGWGDFNEVYEMNVIVAARSLIDTYSGKNSEYFLDRIEDYVKRAIGRDPDALESDGILVMYYVRTQPVSIRGVLTDSNVTDVEARAIMVRCHSIHTVLTS